MSRAKFGSLPWRSRSQRDLAAKSCPANNFVIWNRILKIFHRNDHHIEMTCRAQHLGRSLPWRSRSKHDLAAKSCPAQIFVTWSRILQLFHRNDHYIETTCRGQHLGHYLKGQGHSMTLQQNRVRPITLLFKIKFYNYFTGMIAILRQLVECNIWVATLKAKVTAWPCSKIVMWPKTLLFEFGFYNYFWKTTSLCLIPIRGALPGSDRLLFLPFPVFFYTFSYIFTKKPTIPTFKTMGQKN